MRLSLLPFMLLPACSPEAERPAASSAAADSAAADSAAADSALPDSLALTAPRGVEVWFTLSRESTAPDGKRCVDRTLEIRRGGTRVPVPLLYTGTQPELVNDSTMRARLSFQCLPGDAYLVDLRTGRPVPER